MVPFGNDGRVDAQLAWAGVYALATSRQSKQRGQQQVDKPHECSTPQKRQHERKGDDERRPYRLAMSSVGCNDGEFQSTGAWMTHVARLHNFPQSFSAQAVCCLMKFEPPARLVTDEK